MASPTLYLAYDSDRQTGVLECIDMADTACYSG